MTILDSLRSSQEQDRPLVHNLQISVSIAELLSRCDRIISALRPYQDGPVGILLDNGIDWVATDLSCQSAGVCVLPLPTFFSNQQMAHAISTTGINVLLSEKHRQIELAGLLHQQQIEATNLKLSVFGHKEPAQARPEGTGKITFTSGSTGTPRGVCLSHRQQLLQAAALKDVVDLKKPRHLVLLPLTTLLENIAGIYSPLLAEGEIIVPSLEQTGVSGSTLTHQQRLIQVISEVKPNTMILVPQLLKILVAAIDSGWQPPDSLRFVAVGGSKVSLGLLTRAWQQNLPVFEGYGLSECCSVVSLNTPAANCPGSCGKPLPHVQIRDVNNEIHVQGNAMLGYLGEPGSWGQNSIATGDLGRLDQQGFLQIEGRRKNLIISSMGRNISPEWVEAELLDNSDIAEAIVLGESRPYCVALIRSINPALSDSDIQERVCLVNNRLPDYARIQAWHRLAEPLGNHPGLLTANGRPRRDVIARNFATLVNSLYSSAAVA